VLNYSGNPGVWKELHVIPAMYRPVIINKSFSIAHPGINEIKNFIRGFIFDKGKYQIR
jgi:hypothetical protein